MVKWEYLNCGWEFRPGVTDKYFVIAVRRNESQALFEYLCAVHPGFKARITKDDVILIEFIEEYTGNDLMNALGALGWELVGYTYGGPVSLLFSNVLGRDK